MLNKTFIQKMKEALLLEKKQLLSQARVEQDIDTDGDETDEIQGNMLIELQNQLSTRNSSRLKRIEDALSRLDKGTYGLCNDCEESIPEKRLTANPYCTTCVSCAEERELEEKQRKRF